MQTSRLPHGLLRFPQLTAAGLAALALGCARDGRSRAMGGARVQFDPSAPLPSEPADGSRGANSGEVAAKSEVATLAGGCFWGMEELLRGIPGVGETMVGYTGGTTPNATYDLVKTGESGHAEAVQIVFDPSQVSYEQLLLEFFRMHDPTTRDQQGNDRGSQYRSAIFYHSAEQKRVAEQVKRRVDESGAWKRSAVTEIVPAGPFYAAEDYHQDYLQKHPRGYTCHYLRPLAF